MFRPVTILYRLCWAMVVTGEACKTVSIMLPHGFLGRIITKRHEFDVVDRTHLFAYPTAYASVLINPERPVGNKELYEEATDRSGKQARESSGNKFAEAFLHFNNRICETLQVLDGLRLLLILVTLGVDIHKGQPDITLRHYQ